MSSNPRLEITPTKAMVDEKVHLRLFDFPPHRIVTVRAQMPDDLGRLWKSQATFKADEHGSVDLSMQKPLSGTYDAPDPRGLFWSLALDPHDKKPSLFNNSALKQKTMTFTAEVEGQPIASARLERLFVAPDVARTPIRDKGLVGTFFLPSGPGPHPGMLVFGGSEGGLWEGTAALFASHGYATLALAYIGLEHLPRKLFNYPLEYFETAIGWLQGQKAVRGDRLAALGASKGGELSLLLGATFPEIKVVIGYVPSGVVYAGFGTGVFEFLRRESGWSYRNKPIPFVPLKISPAYVLKTAWRVLTGKPIVSRPLFEGHLGNTSLVERGTIPVEKISGSVLLISGQDDKMWPSAALSEIAIDRLTKHNHPYPFKHLSYRGAGHVIGFPSTPATVTRIYNFVYNFTYAIGGNAKDNAFAQLDSWPQVLTFLEQNLK